MPALHPELGGVGGRADEGLDLRRAALRSGAARSRRPRPGRCWRAADAHAQAVVVAAREPSDALQAVVAAVAAVDAQAQAAEGQVDVVVHDQQAVGLEA